MMPPANLSGYGEAAILAIIGRGIAPPYSIGTANCWHKKAASIAERRLAEFLASTIFTATGDDPLARSIAVLSARHAAAHEPAPLAVIIHSAMDCGIAEIDRQLAIVMAQHYAIRATRTRAVIGEIRAARNDFYRRGFELLDRRDAASKELNTLCAERDEAPDIDWASVTESCVLAAIRYGNICAELKKHAAGKNALRALHLSKEKRHRLDTILARLRRLKAARRALQRVLRQVTPNTSGARCSPARPPANVAVAL
jgi:hypothetical protein